MVGSETIDDSLVSENRMIYREFSTIKSVDVRHDILDASPDIFLCLIVEFQHRSVPSFEVVFNVLMKHFAASKDLLFVFLKAF